MIIDYTELDARLDLRAKLAQAMGTDDVYGAREDRRKDLGCILDRDPTEPELDAWIIDSTLPASAP